MLWTVDLLNFVPLTHVTQALSGHITCNISKNRLVYLGEDTGYFAHLNLALSTDLKKNSRFTQFILGCLSRQNFYNSKDRLMGSNLSPSLSPCLSSGNHSLVLFQEVIEGFDCKINGRFLGVKAPAVDLHSFGWLDCQAQTQGVSKSAAVAAGLLGTYRLVLMPVLLT